MNRADPRAVLSQIHRLAGSLPADDAPDGELLERFRGGRDQCAFAVLVRRHGPLVWGVCRRVLGDRHDAEDAFQAAFLILVKKAHSIRRAESLGAWLHRVARQLAQRARANRDRRRQVEAGRGAAGAAGASLSEELSLREGLAILDEELGRLPEKFRAPVVLCYLQGRTNEEAARELGCAAGTLKSRLGRARELLARRLVRRGVALPAGAAAVLLATGAGEAAALPAAARVAATFSIHETPGASAEALRLAHQLTRAMAMNRIKLWAAGLLALAVVGAGAGALVRQAAWGGAPPPSASAPAERDTPAEQPGAKADLHGDPLPPGAVARLGTVRWRHGARASVLAFAAGGKEVVTAGPEGMVRVWDADSGKELRRFGKPAEPNPEAPLQWPTALSPDGKWAATTTVADVLVWDVGTGKEVRRFKVERRDELFTVALTPDGKGLLMQTLNGGPVLWDVETGTERHRFHTEGKGDQPGGFDGGVVFAPDGKLLAALYSVVKEATGEHLAGLRLWDTATGKVARTITEPLKEEGGAGGTPDPAFSADGKLLARVAADGTIRLHDTATGKEKRSLGEAGKEEYIDGLAFAPDGKSLAALLGDQKIRLYDTATGKVLHTLAEGAARPGDVPGAGNPNRPYHDDGPATAPLVFSPDGKTLAVVAAYNVVRLWDPATGKPRPSPAGHGGSVADVAVSADGKVIVTWGSDDTLRRWDRATGKELSRIVTPGPTNDLALSPAGRLLAYTDDATLRVWEVSAKKDVVKIALPDDGMNDLTQVYLARFSADEKLLATGDLKGRVRLWDTGTGKELRKLAAPQRGDQPAATVTLAEFSPDGRSLLTAYGHNDDEGAGAARQAQPPGAKPAGKSSVCVWDVATGAVLRRWEVAGAVSAAAFTADGRAVATATGDRVTIWEVATGKERFHCEGGGVQVSCSPDGRVLAASSGSAVRLIDLRTGKEFRRLKGHDANVAVLVFTADGKCLVSGSYDSTALVWGGATLAPPAPKINEQSADKLAALWPDLADADPANAFRAASAFAASPKGAAALLAERVKPAAGPDAKQMARWVRELDDDSFEVREKAAAELDKLGELARPALEEALKKRPSVEARRLIVELLGRIKPGGTLPAEDLRRVRAVEVLEGIATPEAKRVLEELAKGAPGAALTRDAAAALRRLNAGGDKP
jgi:RNA polymerase sigma factor (sigma-70 family)